MQFRSQTFHSIFFYKSDDDHQDLHSFPTRRSSDLQLSGIRVCDGDYYRWRDGYLQRLSRSEEHTSELQSRGHLVCRLLLEKKNSGCERSFPSFCNHLTTPSSSRSAASSTSAALLSA